MNADVFNSRYPVGTTVFAYPAARPEDDRQATRLVTKTRSRASVLGGHTDVVWVDGHSACIALSHVDVVTVAEYEAALLADAVAREGALPTPAGPAPVVPTEQQIEALVAAGDRVVNDEMHQHLCMCDAWPKSCVSSGNYFMGAWDVDGLGAALPAVLGLWEQMRGGELAALRAQVASLNESLSAAADRMRADAARISELEAERAKYVGREPTIAEEMAYLSRCVQAVGGLTLPETLKVESIDPQYRNGYVHALADMRLALESPERSSYPPALPWATLMDDDDRAMFLDELADSATTHASSDEVLKAVEETCATWRLIAEAQHGHNTAPGPDALTVTFSPVASLREPDGEFHGALHHTYRVGHDLPETGGAGRG